MRARSARQYRRDPTDRGGRQLTSPNEIIDLIRIIFFRIYGVSIKHFKNTTNPIDWQLLVIWNCDENNVSIGSIIYINLLQSADKVYEKLLTNYKSYITYSYTLYSFYYDKRYVRG